MRPDKSGYGNGGSFTNKTTFYSSRESSARLPLVFIGETVKIDARSPRDRKVVPPIVPLSRFVSFSSLSLLYFLVRTITILIIRSEEKKNYEGEIRHL